MRATNYIKIYPHDGKPRQAREVFFNATSRVDARRAYVRAVAIAEGMGGATLSVWRSCEGVPGEVTLIGEVGGLVVAGKARAA